MTKGSRADERRSYGEIDPRWRKRYRAVSLVTSYVLVLAGLLALMGRVLDIPDLAQWFDRLQVRPMQPATALAFVLGGLAVMGALLSSRRWLRWLGLGAAAAVACGGVVVVVANVADLSFPRWLLNSFEAEDVIGGERLARPAGNEGVVLAVLGVSVVLLATRHQLAHATAQLLALAAAMTGATVVVAFIYGDGSLRGFPFGAGRMAISAALLTIVFAVAVVTSRPALGLMAPIISPWLGGIVLRRLLPFVLAGPPVAVALLLTSVTPESQPRWLALVAVVVSGLLVIALFATAAAVSRTAQSQRAAEEITERATTAVGRDAEIVDVLLSRLSGEVSDFNGLDLAVRFRPAEGWLAGDSILTVPLGGSRLAVILIDVVGHGPEPALAATRLGDAIQHSLRTGATPAVALQQALWVLDEPQMMAGVSIMEIDAETGAVRHSAGGAPPVLHVGSGGVGRYESTGPALISNSEATWDERTLLVEKGDFLVIFSDGIADPTSPTGIAVASVDDLADALQRCPYVDAESIADWCLDEAVGRAEGRVRDDASLIVIGRPGGQRRERGN